MTGRFGGVGAVTLFVEDLERAKRFYAGALGLGVVFEDADSVAFDFGNTIINLLSVPAARDLVAPGAVAPGGQGSRFQLTIWVDDADAAVEELTGHGVILVSGPADRDWGKRTASFTDPDGHLWELAQDLPPKR